MQKQILSKSIALTFGVLVLCFVIGFIVFAWTEPSVAPPGGNVPTPLNVGSIEQWKEGELGIGSTPLFDINPGGIAASAFYDIDNNSWYIDPAGNSVFSGNVGIGKKIPTKKLDVVGDIQATGDICTDQDGGKCLSTVIGGCSAGFVDTGFGYCIQQDENSEQYWHDASDYCATQYSARLCSVSEWYNACMNTLGLANMTNNWEFVDDWVEAGPILEERYAVAVGNGACVSIDQVKTNPESEPFRCCRSK